MGGEWLVVDMEDLIALVGMACRFPGDIRTPEGLWRFVCEGGDAIGSLPGNRGWNIADLYDPDHKHPGKIYVKNGFFLRDLYDFDADFFGMGPREAKTADPHQRIVLEVAWEALERSGIVPLSLRGSRTGVFVGCQYGMYYTISGNEGRAAHDNYWGTGTASSIVSGRISYVLGLEGPAITVDAGCSSSLVALHLACQSLRLGECDLALAGGVTVMTSPDPLIYFSRQHALAPDGRCKPFAAAADGTSFAEGAGVLAAERLSDARRLGHPVLAVVKGSALSQDGATSTGLTAPSTHAQTLAIRAALRTAGLGTADVDAVEAHGTGTVVGDPIEADALIETYGQGRRDEDQVWVGSVKSNIGHTQSAAGMAGIIKMVLAMHHGQLPKTLHVDRPTPQVDWSRGAVALLTESVPWPERGHPRRAGVSSFGIGGTNAHVILEEPASAYRQRAVSPRPRAGRSRAGAAIRTPLTVPFLLSAKSAPALRDQARQLAEHLASGSGGASVADLGHALATTRSRFGRRAVVLAANHTDLRSRLHAFAEGKPDRNVIAGEAHPHGKTVFVFPGQGAQWPGMAARLLAESKVFARHLADCDDALATYVDWSLVQILRKGPDQAAIDRVDVVQPALFAISVSLAALWRSMGVEPDAVVGHSQGEIAAACACGALSLSDAARISALRGKVLAQLAGTGAMASLSLSLTDSRRLLAGRGEAIEIAAVNGPSSTIVAGAVAPMDAFIRDAAAAGIEAKRIAVDYASHSAQVEPLRDALIRELAGISAGPGDVPFYSTVAAGLVDTATLDTVYWWENLRRPVRFADAVRVLNDDGFGTFIEASPHPVLVPAIRETLDSMAHPAETATVIGSLYRGRGGRDQFLEQTARAYVAGVPVNWESCFDGHAARHVDLPTYPFQRKSYTLEAPPARDVGAAPETTRFEPPDSRFNSDGDLFRVDWIPMPGRRDPAPLRHVAVVGQDAGALAPALRESGSKVTEYAAADQLLSAVRAGIPVPRTILTSRPAPDPAPLPGPAQDAHAAAAWALDTVRAWLNEDGLSEARLVIVTRQAIACEPEDRVAGLPEAAVWGLARSAQSEHPGRFALVDLDDCGASLGAIPTAVASGESQVVIRDGVVRVPRLVPADTGAPVELSLPPAPGSGVAEPGYLAPDATRPLGPAEVRVEVRACGLNYGDVSPARPAAPARAALGSEIAGVVTATGRAVTALKAGDRVMGLAGGGMGPITVTDHRCLTTIPDGWSFAEAATVPVAFLTAYHGLRNLARTRAGDRILIHAAASGVGMAAAQIAGRLGAEVFATASPGEWPVLKAIGIPEDHIASSRDPGFDVAFLWGTGGSGVDAVLNSLPDRLTDASFRLLRTGGRLIEVAKTDGRSPADPEDRFPDVARHAFDLMELPPGQIGTMLARLRRMFGRGELSPLPLRALDIRHVRAAFRLVRDSRPAGKIVLARPPRHDPEGTVLITGGTGVLGGKVARHLAAGHDVRHLLLASRHGGQAPGARELAADLRQLGAEVTFAACDVARMDELKSLVDTVPAGHPLTGVIHAAAVVDDCVLTDMTRERLGTVLRPKVDAAWNLYESTRRCDLQFFILFTSIWGILGYPGAGNYAAANALLDSFAAYLRARGVPATALAWGTWASGSGLIDLTPSDHARIVREEGLLPLDPAHALAQFDRAVQAVYPHVVPARFDAASLAAKGADRTLRPLLNGLASEHGSSRADLPAMPAVIPAPSQELAPAHLDDAEAILKLVVAQAAIVLDHPDPDAIEAQRSFRDLGFDSLSSLELTRRLSASTDLKLPPRLARTCETPADLAAVLHARIRREGVSLSANGRSSAQKAPAG